MQKFAIVTAALALLATQAQALERLDGYFIALEACEAFQSKNRQTNPGDILTEPMHAYAMRGINKPGGDFFQITFPDAPLTEARWVHISCGAHVVAATPGAPAQQPTDAMRVEPATGPESADNLLALSWQPAFCESKPGKAECEALNAGNLPITETQLSIHGLWAQPRNNIYCRVPEELRRLDKASRWSELPELDLDAETAEALDVAMPGRASFLDRHEWIKHGTCHRGAGGADEYYDDTLTLTDAINESEVGQFLAAHVGATVQMTDLRAAFDTAFGVGAGERVQFKCQGDQGRVLLQELRINLKGTIASDSDISALFLAGEPQSLGCPEGVIDPAGLQ